MPSADRMKALFDHLGIARAHVLACMSGDWSELVAGCADRACSLTVVAPHLNKGIPDELGAFPAPGLVVCGDQGAPARRARDLADRFGQGEICELAGYESPAWADTVADRTEEVGDAIAGFLSRAERERGEPTVLDSAGEGEVAGIRYRVRGRGPALVLMPLSLAPSQWEPLIPRLSDRYAVVQLGGPDLGVISLLEARVRSGYGELVAQVLGQTGLASGQAVLEVGSGSGALVRGLAKRTGDGVAIVAADLNPYLLSEARALAEAEGLSDRIAFEQADAEGLPYPDGRFDLAFCCTVLEEGDADRMLAELARVTRPGGKVAVVTRAVDVDWWVNFGVPSDLKRKIDALGPSTGAGVGDRGCADASLYGRVLKTGLSPVSMGPQFAIYRDGERLEDVLDRLLAPLDGAEARTCRDAVGRARANGVLFVAEPFHCAVAQRP